MANTRKWTTALRKVQAARVAVDAIDIQHVDGEDGADTGLAQGEGDGALYLLDAAADRLRKGRALCARVTRTEPAKPLAG